MASQIASLTVVYSTVYSGASQRKIQSSASLASVRGIHRRPVNFPHKGPVTRKMYPSDDVTMPLDFEDPLTESVNVVAGRTVTGEAHIPKFHRKWNNGRSMMTSSNWNIFHVTGHLCGEFTGSRSQRPVTQSFDVFFDLRLDKRLSKQS